VFERSNEDQSITPTGERWTMVVVPATVFIVPKFPRVLVILLTFSAYTGSVAKIMLNARTAETALSTGRRLKEPFTEI